MSGKFVLSTRMMVNTTVFQLRGLIGMRRRYSRHLTFPSLRRVTRLWAAAASVRLRTSARHHWPASASSASTPVRARVESTPSAACRTTCPSATAPAAMTATRTWPAKHSLVRIDPLSAHIIYHISIDRPDPLRIDHSHEFSVRKHCIF